MISQKEENLNSLKLTLNFTMYKASVSLFILACSFPIYNSNRIDKLAKNECNYALNR